MDSGPDVKPDGLYLTKEQMDRVFRHLHLLPYGEVVVLVDFLNQIVREQHGK